MAKSWGTNLWADQFHPLGLAARVLARGQMWFLGSAAGFLLTAAVLGITHPSLCTR